MRRDFLIRAALQRNGLSQQKIELLNPGNAQVEAICHGVVNSISALGERLESMICKVPFYFQNVMWTGKTCCESENDLVLLGKKKVLISF